MHELSIAQSLLELVEAQALESGIDCRVVGVRVKIGALSGVVPEALRSAFGPASAGTLADGARLTLDYVPAAIWCERCQAEREPGPGGRLLCPVCGARAGRVVRGRELELVSLEVVDDAEDRSGPSANP